MVVLMSVADHELGDMRRHPIHDGVREEQPAKSWGVNLRGRLLASVSPV
jgi:hypothetical protein